MLQRTLLYYECSGAESVVLYLLPPQYLTVRTDLLSLSPGKTASSDHSPQRITTAVVIYYHHADLLSVSLLW